MKLKIISVLTGTLLLAACSSDKDANRMAEANAIPGSVEDFNRNVNNKAFFAFDQSHLESEAQNNMDSVAAWNSKYPHAITVEGHTDSRGTAEYNLGLGQRRAEAAKNHLQKRGVQNLTTVSYGKSRLPAGQDDSEATHAQNRVAIANIN